jgi:hypothetical protein
MRLRTIAIGVLALISLASCGSADMAAPDQTATGTPVAQVPSATTMPAAQVPSATTEATAMPASPSPTPREQPTTIPSPTSPALTETPLIPANPATLAPAPTQPQPAAPAPAPIPPNSVVVAPPLGPGITAVVDTARADLARRRSVAIDTVELVQIWTVVWPDGGLGCPRPGMVYPQVQVDGWLIRLRVGAQMFDYHGDGIRPPFLCEKSPDGTAVPAPAAP